MRRNVLFENLSLHLSTRLNFTKSISQQITNPCTKICWLSYEFRKISMDFLDVKMMQVYFITNFNDNLANYLLFMLLNYSQKKTSCCISVDYLDYLLYIRDFLYAMHIYSDYDVTWTVSNKFLKNPKNWFNMLKLNNCLKYVSTEMKLCSTF